MPKRRRATRRGTVMTTINGRKPYEPPPGRAATHKQKRLIVDRLYAAWLKAPHLRFGQMVAGPCNPVGMPDLFQVEDEVLARYVEMYCNE